MAGAVLLQLRELRFSLGGAPLFEGASLALHRGERACLVGRNGAGKSTLLRIAAGRLEPDSGERVLAQSATVAWVEQEPDLSAFPTLGEYAAAPLGGVEVPRYAAEAALDQFGLDPERSTAGLSGGETRRASIARAFAAAPDVLLLDEPTNHLDITTIELLERRLSGFAGACLIISHDKRFLERVTTRCFWLRQGKVLSSPEGFSQFDDWAAAVELEDERALSRLETHLKAEEQWLRRGVTARRSRNEGRRARLMEMRAERRARQAGHSADARIAVEQGVESGRLVIEARGLTKSYPGLDRPLVKDLSLRVMRGDRVGIVGPNGAGKSTLIGLLLRTIEPDAGSVRHGANLQIVHVDQTRSALSDDVSVRDALTPGGGDQVMVQGRPRHVAAYAADFLFTPAQLRQPAGALSGGERNRLALAIALAQPANLLVLDEPTNDLDMDTLEVLTEALAAYDGAALIVSHDRAFLDDVTTDVLGAVGGGRWAETPGGYADFEREHGGFARPESPPVTKPAPAPSPPPRRSSTKLSYKEERRLAELEAAIPRLEAEIAALEAELADPDLYARAPDRFTAASRRLDAARSEKDAAETEWLELEDKREEKRGA